MNERRFRVVMTPERPNEVEHAKHASWWPTFDVIDPPGWLADTAGKDLYREAFEGFRQQLKRDGFEFNKQRDAWVRVAKPAR